MNEKLSAVKRRVEAEIEKAKKFVGEFVAEKHEGADVLRHPCAARRCSCEVPAPCWLPEDLGDLEVGVEASGTARLSVRVRNTDGQALANVTASVSGTGAALVVPVNASAAVPAYGHATFNFAAAVPQQTPAGPYVDVQITIQGRRAHILNWRVDVVEKCEPDEKSSHEVLVCDGADSVHRWYDHFYCDHRHATS